MASSQYLKALLKSHLDGNDELFTQVAEQIASHEDRLGHTRVADDLRMLLAQGTAKRTATTRKVTPLALPQGELAGLLDISYPKTKLTDMVLSEEIQSKLIRTVREQRHLAKILAHGLKPRRKLLLVGSPGTGKTMTAAVLAAELSLPLFRVRLDTLISKYLGETASKMRLVFDAMQETRGVYFFDEFDAIASQRGISNDVGEVRRTLNSFLQMIEQEESSSLIVAATNHPEILDYAVFRRFDDMVRYELPDEDLIKEILANLLAGFVPEPTNWQTFVQHAHSLSYADLVRAAEEAIKEALIHDASLISETSLAKLFDERRAMRQFG